MTTDGFLTESKNLNLEDFCAMARFLNDVANREYNDLVGLLIK